MVHLRQPVFDPVLHLGEVGAGLVEEAATDPPVLLPVRELDFIVDGQTPARQGRPHTQDS